jgi:hypothetical protein
MAREKNQLWLGLGESVCFSDVCLCRGFSSRLKANLVLSFAFKIESFMVWKCFETKKEDF